MNDATLHVLERLSATGAPDATWTASRADVLALVAEVRRLRAALAAIAAAEVGETFPTVARGESSADDCGDCLEKRALARAALPALTEPGAAVTVTSTLTVPCDAHRTPDCQDAWAAEGASADDLDVERDHWTRVFRGSPPAEPAEEYWRDVCPACAALDASRKESAKEMDQNTADATTPLDAQPRHFQPGSTHPNRSARHVHDHPARST